MNVSTVHWLELTWTLVATFALAVKVFELVDTIGDVGAAKRGGDPVTYLIARGNLRNVIGRILVKLTIIVTGVYFMTQPPSNPDRPMPSIAVVLAVSMILITLMLLFLTVMDRIDRRITLATLQTRRSGDVDLSPDCHDRVKQDTPHGTA